MDYSAPHLPQPFVRCMTWLVLLTFLGPLALPVFGPPAQAQIRPAPIAQDDAYRVAPGGTLQIDAPGVLENDTAPTGATLKAILVDAVSQGTLTLNTDGSLTYQHARNQPTADDDSTDRFTYQATDGAQLSTIATVTLTITPDDTTPPTARPGRLTLDEDTNGSLDLALLVTDPDGDPLTFGIATAPAHGTAFLEGSVLIYTPVPDYAGPDQLIYRVRDGQGGTATARVDLTITPVNDPPTVRLTALPPAGSVPLAVVFTPAVRDAENDPLTFAWDFGDGATSAADGSVTHTYTEAGVYTATLTVSDGQADANAQQTIRAAESINTPPVVTITTPAADTVIAPGTLAVTGTASDADGTIASVLVNEVPATISGDQYAATIPLDGGNQVIHVIALDDRGDSAATSRVLAVDAAGPLIEMAAPRDRQAVYTSQPTITLNYRDLHSAVDPASLRVTLDDGQTTISVPMASVTEIVAEGTPAEPLADDTSYTLIVELADTLGNTSVATSTFYVPTAPDNITPPAEPAQAGWVSGVVYDSATCDAHLTTCQGLPGARVTLEQPDAVSDTAVPGVIVTGPDGFFAFPVDETGTYWLRIEKDGYTYGQREAVIVRERSTATNAIYLTPLDPALTVCDTAGCEHQNSDDSIRLSVPAGAIPDGETVDITATTFEQVEFLPSGELPPETWETYAFNLGGDSEAAFLQPVTVHIRNTRGFTPGTEIPLGYWNQNTQQWEHAGTGVIDDSGEWVVIQVMHFSNYDCNDPIAPPGISINHPPADEEEQCEADDGDDGGEETETADDGGDGDDPEEGKECDEEEHGNGNGPDDKDEDEDEECNGEAGCFINYKSGTLHEWINLPPINVLGQHTAPELRYHTRRANPSQVIDIQLELEDLGDNITELGDYIAWELFIEGEQTDSFTFAADLEHIGEVGRYRYLWDGRNAQGERLPAGVYAYRVRLGIPYRGEYCYALDGIFGNPPDCENGSTGVFVDAIHSVDVAGTVALESDPTNPLGQGWALEGQQRLYRDDLGRIVITDGRGLDEFEDFGVSSTTSGAATQYDRPVKSVLQPLQSDADLADSAPTEELLSEPSDDSAAEQPYTATVTPTRVDVCGALTEDTTWSAENSPYVMTCNVSVSSGITLTIEPGTVVKGATDGLYRLQVSSAGRLIAEGTAEEPIVFTSLNDAEHGGDMNGDDDTAPAPADWGGIRLSHNSQSLLDHLLVQYASQGIFIVDNLTGPASVVTVQNSQLRYNTTGLIAHLMSDGAVLTLRNNQIEANEIHGIALQGPRSHRATNPTLTLIGNTISHNGVSGLSLSSMTANGLRLTVQDNIIAANQREAIQISFPGVFGNEAVLNDGEIVVQGNTVSDNGTNAMAMGGVVHGSLTLNWGDTVDLPVVSPGTSNLVVDRGSRLRLTPGMVYKEDAGGLRVFGTLQAVGTPTRPIVFTSFRDDAHGGDTNGDGDFRDPASGAVAPAPGDWNNLDFRAESSASRLEHVLVTYALRAVETRTSDLQITRSHLHANERGITVTPDSNGAPLSVLGNTFTAHTLAAVDNAGLGTLDVRGNWWDDASGPTHPDNPDGQGETIVGDVLFDPWLTSADDRLVISRTATDFSTLDYNPDDDTYTRTYQDGTQVQFDADGRHAVTLEPDGRRTAYTYHPDGTLATMGVSAPGADTPAWVWTFDYTDGRLSRITDPAGRVTSVEIDAHNHLVAATVPDTGTFRFAYDERHLLTHYTEPNDEVTHYTYDAYGRIQTVSEPPRVVFDSATEQVETIAQVRTFTPSDTSYALINDSPTGTPDAPAPAVPRSADLVDQVDYGRGSRSGRTNEWGSWQEVTDGANRTTSYGYNTANQVTRMTEPDGDCTRYTYDDNGNTLTRAQMGPDQCALPRSERDPNQIKTWRYTYEERFNQVKTATDPLGNTTVYVYDYEEGVGVTGHLIRTELPAVADEHGQVVTPTLQTSYNTLGLVETETDARNTVTRYVYTQGTPEEAADGATPLFAPGVTPIPGLLHQVIRDASGEHLTTTSTEFDFSGKPGRVTGPGGRNPMRYGYDAFGRVISQTDTLGIVTTFTYDHRGNMLQQVVDYTPDGTTGHNVMTTYTYNADDQPTSEMTTADGLTVQTRSFYDINGKLAAQANNLDQRTRYRYDDADQLINVIDPTGAVITTTYTLDGQVERAIDPAGSVTSHEYDAFGRLVRQVVDAGGANLVMTRAYDLNDNLIRERGPDGTMTCFAYDSHNRRTAQIDDCGDDPDTLNLTSTTVYDLNGNVVRSTDERGVVTYQEYDALGRTTLTRRDDGGLNLASRNVYAPETGLLVQVIDEPRGTVNELHYDDRNRVEERCADVQGHNLCAQLTYDRLGHQETSTDPNGVTTRTHFNAFGLPTEVIADAGGHNAVTSYTYDDGLRRTSMTDANGNTTTYAYTDRNELAQEMFADTTSVSYTYDARGNRTTMTDQAGQTSTYHYDRLSRLETVSDADGTRDYDYEPNGRLANVVETRNGHTTSVAYGYDALGSVLTETQTLDGSSFTVGYAYDYVAGQQTITYPSGVQRVQQRDPIGRLDTVRHGDGTLVTDYRYDDHAGTQHMAHANGVTELFETDPLGRIKRVSSAVADYRYGYDAAGNRTALQRAHLAEHPYDVYQYDGLYQLTDVWYGADAATPEAITSHSEHQHYTLDHTNNRLALATDASSQSYLPNDGTQLTNPMHRYEQVDSTSLAYDPRGNTLSDGLNSYSYDLLNRQIGMTGPGGSADYIYDVSGRRVATVVNGTLTRFVYDWTGQVLEEYAADGTLLARYTYGQGIDAVLTMERNGTITTYHRDGLGSITEVTDASGALVERYTYDVYGTPTILDAAGNVLTASAIGNPYLFTGRRYDAESGNYHYRARNYRPTLGRFLQQDPLGTVDGPNRYAYVHNNPTNMVDPSGLSGRKITYTVTQRGNLLEGDILNNSPESLGFSGPPVEIVGNFVSPRIELIGLTSEQGGKTKFDKVYPEHIGSLASLPTFDPPGWGSNWYLATQVQVRDADIRDIRNGCHQTAESLVTVYFVLLEKDHDGGFEFGFGAEGKGGSSFSATWTWGWVGGGRELLRTRTDFYVHIYTMGEGNLHQESRKPFSEAIQKTGLFYNYMYFIEAELPYPAGGSSRPRPPADPN